MAKMDTDEVRPRGSVDFTESSILDTIIPLASDLNIEEALSGSVERLDEGSDSPLAAIPQRTVLYFDETVDVYVVLQTPYFDERTLRSYLGRIVINLEAQVVNQSDAHDALPAHEIIYNSSVQDSEDPLIVVQGPDESDEDGGEGHILIVWKLSAFLVRPRLRLQAPSITFSAMASLKPAEQVESHTLREEYLPSQIPSGMNLLEAFSNDPALGGIKPHLSALRVSRVTPASFIPRDSLRPFKNLARRSIKVFPAINARVRYSRPNATPSNPSVIASLDIDITSFVNCEVMLTKVELKINGGTVENMNTFSGMALPISALPQDDITFLYRLLPDDMDILNKTQVRTLDITIIAKANLAPTSQPEIRMHWTASLDFTPPINPGFSPITPPIQRPHRPAQLSIGGTPFENTPTVSSLAVTRPDALPAVDIITRQQRNSAIPDFGVTMSFTGPTNPVHPGSYFVWSVFIVNRSNRPRKLAITVLPKRRRAEIRSHRPPSTSYGNSKRDPKIADAVVDDNIIYAMQKNSALDSTELVCLSTDTRVGPLAPLACYEVELRFLALKIGVLGVEAVRVVDLGTQEHVDIRDLPSIVSVPIEESHR